MADTDDPSSGTPTDPAAETPTSVQPGPQPQAAAATTGGAAGGGAAAGGSGGGKGGKGGKQSVVPMQGPKKKRRKVPWTPLRIIGLATVLALISGGGYLIYEKVSTDISTDRAQSSLQPFYDPPADLPTEFGQVIRSEPVSTSLVNGRASRVLYTSADASGAPIAVSGLVFEPNKPASPAAPVVTWAHPTLGQADKCAPSRSSNPLKDTTVWLDEMLGRGWVVAATDYAGLGTPGPKSYLIGPQSARDIMFSARAAKSLVTSPTRNDVVIWGHSQGGQAALFAADQAASVTPELSVKGVAVAAPAAMLAEIMGAQWDTGVAWAIGPEATQSFVTAYPDLDVMAPLTDVAKRSLPHLESDCVVGAALEGEARETFGQNFFKVNPTSDPAWSQIVKEQTPGTIPAGMPMLLVQGTADEVVLASTNALLQKQWCAQNVNVSTLWLGGVDHSKAAVVGGPAAVMWAADRFDGKTQTPNCIFPPPVAPATPDF